MKKLKTLKDLKSIQAAFDHNDHTFGSNWTNTSQLKAEAIKWVKFYRRNILNWREEDFKMFFNITKEDLK